MTDQTPLNAVDPNQVAAFWRRFLEATNREPATAQPEAWAFGDSVELANELIELVLHGPKRATAGSVADYESDGEPMPQVGDLEIVTDGQMQPRAVLEITEVRIGPLLSVDAAFAWDEGEGDRSLDYWVEAHTGFFSRYLPTIGVEFTPEMPTIFQRFEVVYSE